MLTRLCAAALGLSLALPIAAQPAPQRQATVQVATEEVKLKLTRLRGARQAFAGGVFDAAYPPALFAGVSAPNG
jgi:hypothetical protein